MTDKPQPDYLWDGAGPPDPDVASLEDLLAPLRYREPLDQLRLARERRRARWRRLAPAAAAAVLLLALGAIWLWPRAPRVPLALGADAAGAPAGDAGLGQVGHAESWPVAALQGTARANGQELGMSDRLPIGSWLETLQGASARLQVADIGSIDVREHSRLRIVASSEREHRVELARGSIHAVIMAPPRIFLVETPSALAVDLGCEYTLEVDERGDSRLHVTSGWVALQDGEREVLVPAGAVCETRAGAGPGTPYAEDASEGLIAALRQFDRSGEPTALEQVLTQARRDDSVSLWNLFLQSSGPTRTAVYERLAALVPPPEGATRERLLAGDRSALTWWRLTLEDVWFGYDEPDEP